MGGPGLAAAVNAVIFDVGGVLLQLEPERTFAAFARIGAAGFERIWREDTPQNSLHEFEVGHIDTAEFRRQVNQALGTRLADQDFDRAFNAMLGPIADDHFALLATLGAKLPLYVLSNNNVLHLPAIEARYPAFRGYFRQAFFSQDIGAHKPEARAFTLTLERSGLEAASTLFVDDSQANVEAARATGLQALHLPRNGDLRAALKSCLPSTLGL